MAGYFDILPLFSLFLCITFYARIEKNNERKILTVTLKRIYKKKNKKKKRRRSFWLHLERIKWNAKKKNIKTSKKFNTVECAVDFSDIFFFIYVYLLTYSFKSVCFFLTKFFFSFLVGFILVFFFVIIDFALICLSIEILFDESDVIFFFFFFFIRFLFYLAHSLLRCYDACNNNVCVCCWLSIPT